MSLIFARLPIPLRHVLLQTRFASTSPKTGQHSEPGNVAFPFPLHRNPTPHEIFHLPRGASQSQIKARYYELVRLHHPDCPTARALPPTTSHSRFQAISDAYGILSGKKTSSAMSRHSDDAAYYEEIQRRKRAQWRASASSDEFGTSGPSLWDNGKERWDQGLLIFIVVFALASSIIPISMLSPFTTSAWDRRHYEAAKNLADARRDAREFAEVRRVARIGRKKDKEMDQENDLPASRTSALGLESDKFVPEG